MKILIVDDEKHIAEGLRFNLEADDFEVETAHDGAENGRFYGRQNFARNGKLHADLDADRARQTGRRASEF